MTATDLPVLAETVAAKVADHLRLDGAPRLREVPPVRAVAAVRVTYHGVHACLYCGKHHCEDRDRHHSWHVTHEVTQRWPVARVYRCPACGGDSRQAGAPGEPVCFEVVRVDPSAVTR